jgi:hypothetical protein
VLGAPQVPARLRSGHDNQCELSRSQSRIPSRAHVDRMVPLFRYERNHHHPSHLSYILYIYRRRLENLRSAPTLRRGDHRRCRGMDFGVAVRGHTSPRQPRAATHCSSQRHRKAQCHMPAGNARVCTVLLLWSAGLLEPGSLFPRCRGRRDIPYPCGFPQPTATWYNFAEKTRRWSIWSASKQTCLEREGRHNTDGVP